VKLAPIRVTQTAHNPMPSTGIERVGKRAPRQPREIEPAPIAVAEERIGTGTSAGVDATPAPQRWCPLHETSLHDITKCRYLNGVVESRRKCLAECAAAGTTCNCYKCGQPGHMSLDYPGKAIRPRGPDSREGRPVGAQPGYDTYYDHPGKPPRE
jgi:hypothetical protein